ncbi:M28 family peptidase [Gelidibacter sp.]|uniref:M28 family peptidase n=1 Tax=Gelidibacter sp. TaxID=2018083 RepID=UPI002C5002DE|nr:M28 family peptidase [Gelidibacter sp.]HUH28522.1 M28 family peptidase [Gelidibacter sp.]
MKHIIWLTIFAFFGFIKVSDAQELNRANTFEKPFPFNTDSLIFQLKTLSSDAFQGRRTGTAGAEKAKNHIIKKFKNLKVLPFTRDYQQSFSFISRGKSYSGVNILGYVKGSKHPEDYIVVSGHYDHEGIKNNQIYNGADDNASGVAALFAFAEYFETHPPEHSVILAAFDAEELGLSGSRYFVANSIVPLKHIKLNLNMDMISRNDNNQLYVVGTAFNDSLKKAISNYKNSDKLSLLMGHDGNDGLENWTMSSDQAPFHQNNIPFLYFGVEDHQDYHKPTDTFENIHPEFYKNAVKTIISIFITLDAMPF